MIRILTGLILFLAACGPEVTPFPASLPTEAATLTPGGVQAVRYALAANAEGLVADIDLIQASAQIEQLHEAVHPDDLGIRYDMVAVYGDLPGGTRSPVTLHVVLVMNADVPPLDNPVLLDALRKSVNPGAAAEALSIPGLTAETVDHDEARDLRVQLANAGWPDGFGLQMGAAGVPGVGALIGQWQAAGIAVQTQPMSEAEIKAGFESGRIQAALTAWTSEEERAGWGQRMGSENVLDLYSVPISYRAVDGLKISFTPGGWPIGTR